MGTFLAVVGLILGLVVIPVALLISATMALDSWNNKALAIVLGVLAIIVMALTITILIRADSKQEPCAKYSYTYIKGVKYRSCEQRYERVPG